MTDVPEMKRSLVRMTVVSTLTTLVAVGFAIAHFLYGVGWALWAFVGFLAAGFAVQIWFIRGIARMAKGR